MTATAPAPVTVSVSPARAALRFALATAPRPGARLVLRVYAVRSSADGVRVHAGGAHFVRSGALRRHRWRSIDLSAIAVLRRTVRLSLLPGRRVALHGAHAPRLAIVPPAPTPAPAAPSTSAPAPAPAAATPTSSQPCGVTTTAPAWQHVVWIILENKGYDQIIGSPNAPYINGLANQCGLATNFFAEAHPSLPNYIAMTSGSTQGITDDGDPSQHPISAPSIFSQLGAGGWRGLDESMPSNCAHSSSGGYAVRHNPAAYFTNIASQCSSQDVALADPPDVSARFTFITPNLCDDMHDCSVATGNGWLESWVPKILDSAEYRAGNTALFITCDEDEGGSGQHIATIVVAPSTPAGTKDGTRYDHYSMLGTTEAMLGLPALGNAASAPSMRAGFGL
jgi:phosphatidylinositol-3-phosphatase